MTLENTFSIFYFPFLQFSFSDLNEVYVMTPRILLRIASAIILIHNIPHTLGHAKWRDSPDEINRRAIDAMTTNKFQFMGRETSYANFYDGYGYGGTLTLLLVMVILWMISSNQSGLSKQLSLATGIFLVAWAIMEYVYFFPLAAGFTIVAAVLTLVASAKSPR